MAALPLPLLAALLLVCGAVRAETALEGAMYRQATFDLCVRLFTRDGSIGCSGAPPHGLLCAHSRWRVGSRLSLLPPRPAQAAWKAPRVPCTTCAPETTSRAHPPAAWRIAPSLTPYARGARTAAAGFPQTGGGGQPTCPAGSRGKPRATERHMGSRHGEQRVSVVHFGLRWHGSCGWRPAQFAPDAGRGQGPHAFSPASRSLGTDHDWNPQVRPRRRGRHVAAGAGTR